jgi:hypothetical protein
MQRLDWNGLRPGDRVQVHHPPFPVTAAMPGQVLRVTAQRKVNEVAVRMDADGLVHRPRHTAVHLDVSPPQEWCWRCAELETRSQEAPCPQ